MRRIVRWLSLLQAVKADSRQSVKLADMRRSFQRLVRVFTLPQNCMACIGLGRRPGMQAETA